MKTNLLYYFSIILAIGFTGFKYFCSCQEAPCAKICNSSIVHECNLEDLFEDKNERILSKVEELFELQKYDEALKVLTNLDRNRAIDPNLILSEGQIYMYKKDYPKAIELFDKVIYNDQNTSEMVNTAIWLKSMAYMKNDNKSDARKYFEFLKLTGSKDYQRKASKMLSLYSDKEAAL